MSKADVERKRQESNARNREAADRYQKQANEIQEKHAKNQKQLERLREARSALKKAMTTFAELKKPNNIQRKSVMETLKEPCVMNLMKRQKKWVVRFKKKKMDYKRIWRN